MTADGFEYGIILARIPDELHRGPMTFEEADTWMREIEEMGFQDGTFQMVRRPTGNWEVVDGTMD